MIIMVFWLKIQSLTLSELSQGINKLTALKAAVAEQATSLWKGL